MADLCAVSADHVRGLFLLAYPHHEPAQAINAVGRSDVFLKLEVIKKGMGLTGLIIRPSLGH